MATFEKVFLPDLVEEVGSLPTVAAQIVALTSNPQCSMEDLARVVQSDNVMAMRFLALANSAAVSGGQEIRNLRSALVRLGLRRVRNVAFLMGMHDLDPDLETTCPLDLQAFWNHTLAVASCAQGLAWQRGDVCPDDAWLVGLMQGIGILACTRANESGLTAALEMASARQIPLAEAEMLTLDFHHGELGADILNRWNLPGVFAEAVEFLVESVEPGSISEEAAKLIEVLNDAIAIVRAIGFGECGDGDRTVPLAELAARGQIEPQALEALATKVDREVSRTLGLIGFDPPLTTFFDAFSRSNQKASLLGLEGVDEGMAREGLEQELAVARDIQQKLLPASAPVIPGYQIAACNLPSLHVSGDTYDFPGLASGRQGICIADVAGKGMPAALLASNLQATIRALATVFADPGELLAAANKALFDSTDYERFATLFLAALSPESGSLQYASAGHNPPLLVSLDGSCQWLPPAGTPLGMLDEMEYPVREVTPEPGDLLVLYTDGITEAINEDDVEFGPEGLEAVVQENRDRRPDELIQRIIAAVKDHSSPDSESGPAASTRQPTESPDDDFHAADDLTLVLVKRLS